MKRAADASRPGPGRTLALVAMGTAAGVAAVWVRAYADTAFSKLASEQDRARTLAARPGGERPGEKVMSWLETAAGRRLPEKAHKTAGELVEYAMGVVPVIVYALLRPRSPGRGVLGGAAFGATMFVAHDQLLNTVIGLNGRAGDYPLSAHVQGFVAHLIYGAVAELALGALDG